MDINTIDNKKTIWQNICDVLTSKGIDVFPPATKYGECKKPYVVLKQDGSSQIGDYSSERVYYRFILYVPKNKYSHLSVFEKEVKKIIDEELFPLIMPVGQNETDYYDDNFNAHMRSFLYSNNVRNKHL